MVGTLGGKLMNDLVPRRPYAATANILAVINRARSRNLPETIDNDFLRIAGVPENVYSRVLSGLQFLDLIEPDGTPSARLRAMAASPEAEYLEQLTATIREAYREDFKNIDPAEDEQARIIDAFRRYEPRSQTGRMVMLFLGLCRAAGIPVRDAPRERGMQQRASSRRASQQPRSRGGTTSAITDSQSSRGQLHAPAPGLLFGVTEADVAALGDSEFDEVWAALGKVARARSLHTAEVKTETDEGDEEETSE